MAEFKTVMFIVVTVLSLVLFWGGVVYVFSGCTNRDLDLKTSNCSARIDFNCNCEKDSSLLTDTVDSATKIK